MNDYDLENANWNSDLIYPKATVRGKKRTSHAEHLAPTLGTFTFFFFGRQHNGRYVSCLIKFAHVTLVLNSHVQLELNVCLRMQVLTLAVSIFKFAFKRCCPCNTFIILSMQVPPGPLLICTGV